MQRFEGSGRLAMAVLVRFACLTALALTCAYASEEVVFRSGTVNGQPGQIPTKNHVGPVDDNVTYFTVPGCGAPLSTSAFTEADFAAASVGPAAELVVPHDFWTDELASDPDARWIHWNHGAIGSPTGPFSGSARPPQSVLYAIDFEITKSGNTTGTIELWYAADDLLGDGLGPNSIGAYLNGEPLSTSFSGGHFSFETHVVQSDVRLRTGVNTLYLYQRDEGCAVSGIIFSCRVIVNECGEVEPYCLSTPNSTGVPASMWATGGLSVAANQTLLNGSGCPPGEFGMFVYGAQRVQLSLGNGVLCISPFAPGIHRLAPPIVIDQGGGAVRPLNFLALPASGVIEAGSTWHFQLLFRDAAAGGAGFNLSDAIALTFCP